MDTQTEFYNQKMNINDYKHLFRSSQYIGHWIHRQPFVREETLTDWLLFDMSENIRGAHYLSFPRQEESYRTRADWEWWFVFSGFCFAMRVQAKKLYPAYDNYPSIAQTNMYGLQIEKLLHDAVQGNFMTFYAFYTDQRARVMCPNQRNEEGVFIAGVQKIFDAFISSPRELVTVPDVLQHTLSLSCFVCCPLVSGEGALMRAESGDIDVGDRWLHSINIYFKSELGSNFGNEDTGLTGYGNIPGMYQKTPAYIESFIELSRKGMQDQWEDEFAGEIDGANALLVYDFRS